MFSLKSVRNVSLRFPALNKINFSSKAAKQRDLPKCVYVQPPIQWIKNKINFERLKAWDPTFDKKEFLEGSKQALLVTLDLIRTSDSVELTKVTTLRGFTHISRYTRALQKESKASLLCFNDDDISKIVPVDVELIEGDSECECFVEVLFMAMKYLDEIVSEDKSGSLKMFKGAKKLRLIPAAERLLFIEGYLRLHSSYSRDNLINDWKIDFFRFSEFAIVRHKSVS